MNTPKHTPGPWFSGCHGRDWIQIVADDESMLPLGTTSKLVAHVNTSMGEQQCVANAHLIAAAPAMYEALQQSLALVELAALEEWGRAVRGEQQPPTTEARDRLEKVKTALSQAEAKS